MVFRGRAGGRGAANEVLYQPPGENITYGALQNTRFQAADWPKTQRPTLTVRQEKRAPLPLHGNSPSLTGMECHVEITGKKTSRHRRSNMGVTWDTWLVLG